MLVIVEGKIVNIAVTWAPDPSVFNFAAHLPLVIGAQWVK